MYASNPYCDNQSSINLDSYDSITSTHTRTHTSHLLNTFPFPFFLLTLTDNCPTLLSTGVVFGPSYILFPFLFILLIISTSSLTAVIPCAFCICVPIVVAHSPNLVFLIWPVVVDYFRHIQVRIAPPSFASVDLLHLFFFVVGHLLSLVIFLTDLSSNLCITKIHSHVFFLDSVHSDTFSPAFP